MPDRYSPSMESDSRGDYVEFSAYEDIVSELDEKKAEIETLQSNLESAENRVKELEVQLEK